MKKPSECDDAREKLRQSIIGLGERSIRKSYYPELQQRIAELEEKNQELQAEITERMEAQASARKLGRQLQQSQKMEAIGTLAGGIAHDFNNILAIIMGNTELAKLHAKAGCENRNCPVSFDLDNILQASERARDLVRQILTFSRQQDNDKVPLQLGPVIKEALALLRASLPQSIEIRTRIACQDAQILANVTQLHQIIMNLGTNAHYAMRETGGILVVEVEQIEIGLFDKQSKGLLPTPGRYLLLKVCDNGCGMEQSVLDKIFDPYFTTKPLTQGTGMGLAVVHGIVKNHEGLIAVYSEPGKGTSFSIYFPQLSEKQSTPSQLCHKEIPLGTENILLVDDEVMVARMEAELLESLGYTVTYETDPLRALQIFTANPEAYDLIFTDMTMPHMNGLVFTREVLTIRPKIPVILCTGFSELVNEANALSLGAKAFAMKPMVRKSIAEIIRKVFDR
ncbi:MAG: response regulator [Proteobacteria bacterium]|nr:response regulator [Pseudomonadota bacterium]